MADPKPLDLPKVAEPPKPEWLKEVEDDARFLTTRRIREQQEEREFRAAKNQNQSPEAEAPAEAEQKKGK